MDRPQLSLCLIFRDEETMLPDFLKSVAGLWDELVAVDTGSGDGSADLLAEAGARLVSFPWRDDFAAARNASLAAASGRWILFLDADERVSPQLRDQIQQLLRDDQAGAATVVLRNQLPGGHRRDSRLLRLFRNEPSIRFRYRIHEDVSAPVADLLQRENLHLRHLSGVVHHLGYVREVAASRDKKERDLKLLRLSLDQDPDDFYCRFKILEIARFWGDQALWQEEAEVCAGLLARLSAEQASDLKRRQWSGELAALVSQGLIQEPNQSLAWLEKSESWSQKSAAWLHRKATILESSGRLDEAEACFRQCLEIPDEAASQLVGARPLLGLCRLALARGKMEEAGQLARQAADLAPLDQEALLALIACASPESHADRLAGPLADPLAAHLAAHPEAALPVARHHLSQGQAEPAQRLLDPLAPSDPEAALGLLVCRLVLGREFDLRVDVDQQEADRMLRQWIGCLWDSRDPQALGAFAENCAAIMAWFPWLPDFLGSETRRVSGNGN